MNSTKPSEALLASFGVATLREVVRGPNKMVVDGVVPSNPVRCSSRVKLPQGMSCACPKCRPDLDHDYFDFD